MGTRLLGFATLLVALALSGCTHIANVPLTSKDLDPPIPTGTVVPPGSGTPTPSAAPSTPSASPTPTPTPPVLHSKSLKCVKASADVLTATEAVANSGGAVRFTTGQMVHAGGDWWVVAVRQWVDPKSNLSSSSYGKTGDVHVYLTNAPSKDAALRGWDRVSPAPDGAILPDGNRASDKAVSCLPAKTPAPPEPPQPKPSMKCVAPTDGELVRANDDVSRFYGGTVAKVAKVVINAKASVVATSVRGATMDVRGNHPELTFSDANPRDIVITWLYYKQPSRTWSVEVIKNWQTANDGTLQWGPQARTKAISCVK